MYNVLACDDEQIALDSLKFIFEKNFQGNVNLHTALSGFEALNYVKTNDIDIIFMDINMPGMNGLETISLIMNMKPDTVIIVLSAFDTFQYAQEALNLGAFRYITKPVNRNTIIQTTRSAMNMVDTKRGNNINSEEIQKKLESVSPMVESDFFYSCAFCGENEDLTPYLVYFDILNKNYVFMALEIPKETEENRQEIQKQIRQISSENMKCIMGSFMTNRILILFSFDRDSFYAEKVKDELKSLYTLYTIKVNRKICAGISGICTKEIQFRDFYSQAIKALNKTNENNGFVFFEDIKCDLDKTEESRNILERLSKRLLIGDTEGVSYLTKQYLKALEETCTDSDKWKFLIIELIIKAKNAASEIKADFDSSLFENAFTIISKAQTVSEAQTYVLGRLSEAVSVISQSRKTAENPVIKKVCNYINLHLSSDFSLEDAAKDAGISSFYLSKLFKDEMNDTFVNYVTEMKMEKAAHLLKETDMSIKEITAATGYNDQNYFSKIFKNKFELTPSEYRKTENIQ